jgi:hypothetical protein
MHLFVECPFSRAIWEHVAIWSNCGNLSPLRWTEAIDVEDWFLSMTERGSKMAHTLAILTLWCIWKHRNAAVFNASTSTVLQVVARIKDEASLWASAGGRFSPPLFVVTNVASN